MSTLINKQSVITDDWTPYTLTTPASELQPEDRVLVSWEDWQTLSQAFMDSPAKLAVSLPNTVEPEALEKDLHRLEMIAIEFPVFTDGRGYSLARLLREAGYRGELRATGDILPDQLFYLARCGFDTFALKAGKSPDTGLSALRAFSTSYQAAADTPLPIYQRGRKIPC